MMSPIYATAALLLLASAALAQQSTNPRIFQGLGDLKGGRAESCAIAISADGRVVTGWSGAEGGGRAFRWEDGGITELTGDSIMPLVGHAVSADGKVIVGLAQKDAATVGFRWETGVARALPAISTGKEASAAHGGLPAAGHMDVWGVSADGRRAAGELSTEGKRSAVVWTEGGGMVLPPLHAEGSCSAAAISPDGSHVAGHCACGGGSCPVVWRLEEAPGIGAYRAIAEAALPARGPATGEARAFSGNGLCVVGDAGTMYGVEAFRVCGADAITLGGLSREHEFLSSGRSASDNGNIVVGSSIDDRDMSQAAVWDPVNGMRPLLRILAWDYQLDLGGWRLDSATGISADGTTIVGCGRNPKGDPEGWIVRLPKEWWHDRSLPLTAREMRAHEQSPSQASGAPDTSPTDAGTKLEIRPIVPRLARGLARIELVTRPRGVVFGRDGTIYVADPAARAVWQFSEKGAPWQVVFSRDNDFSFDSPAGLAVGEGGDLFVSDVGTHRILAIASDGRLRRSWGGLGSGLGQFNGPSALAVHADKLIVADTGNDRLVVCDTDGTFVRTIGRFGRGDGELDRPADVAADEQGRIYVADFGNDRVCRFEPDGRWISCWGERGSSPGLFNRPIAIEYSGGRVYVVDQANHRVQVFTPEGKLLYTWGRQSLRPRENDGRINFPASVAIAPDQTQAVVCEPLEGRCQIFAMIDESRGGFAVSAYSDSAPYSNFARAIHIGGGMLFSIDDTAGHVLVYRLTDGDPVLVTKVGTHGYGVGQFNDPQSVWYDAPTGALYVADTGNRRVQIFDLPVIGDGANAFSPNLAKLRRAFTVPRFAPAPGGPESPSRPIALALSSKGVLAVASEADDQVVLFNREFSPVLTLAAGDSEDFTLRRPTGVAFSRNGQKLFVLDELHHRVVVFDASGKYIRTFGGKEFGADAIGTAGGIHASADGSVYVSDRANHRVLRFDEEGRLVAKWGSVGIDRGEFFAPGSIAQDSEGRVYVNDFGNRRVQVFTADGTFVRAFGSPMSVRPTLGG